MCKAMQGFLTKNCFFHRKFTIVLRNICMGWSFGEEKTVHDLSFLVNFRLSSDGLRFVRLVILQLLSGETEVVSQILF